MRLQLAIKVKCTLAVGCISILGGLLPLPFPPPSIPPTGGRCCAGKRHLLPHGPEGGIFPPIGGIEGGRIG